MNRRCGALPDEFVAQDPDAIGDLALGRALPSRAMEGDPPEPRAEQRAFCTRFSPTH